VDGDSEKLDWFDRKEKIKNKGKVMTEYKDKFQN